jgi:hypothetical protein
MESDLHEKRENLSTLIKSLVDHDEWWYIVKGGREDEQSLSAMLGISINELERLLGFFKKSPSARSSREKTKRRPDR